MQNSFKAGKIVYLRWGMLPAVGFVGFVGCKTSTRNLKSHRFEEPWVDRLLSET